MTLSQFSCPHCANPFQIDASVASQQVACPHCAQPVSISNEPPIEAASLDEPPVAEPPPIDPPVAELSPPPLAVESPRDYSPSDLLPPSRTVPQDEIKSTSDEPPADEMSNEEPVVPQQPIKDVVADDFLTRQNTYDERASRKFIKNAIIWTVCAIVLLVLLAFFVRPGGG